jgi:hypothetical protein
MINSYDFGVSSRSYIMITKFEESQKKHTITDSIYFGRLCGDRLYYFDCRHVPCTPEDGIVSQNILSQSIVFFRDI